MVLSVALLAGWSQEVAAQPVITSVSPASVTFGITPDSSVTISGTGFVSGATITVGTPVGGPCPTGSNCLFGTTVNGATASASVPFVFVTANVLRFFWDNASLSVGTYNVTVTNPASAGGGTVTLPNAFVVLAPQPTISGSAPPLVTYGVTPNSSITVSGSGFVLGATLTVGTLNGTTVAGTTATAAAPFVFTSSGSVRFYWANTSLSPARYAITVTNPASAGSRTVTLADAFEVLAPQPTVSGSAPPLVTYGITPSTSITVSGSGFVLGATITVGTLTGATVAGTTATAAAPFVFTSSGAMRFYWPNTALPPARYAITVTNPASAGSRTVTLADAFEVLAPQPTISGSAPPQVIYGITPSSSIAVSGSGFVLGATITVGTPTGGTCAIPSCLTGVTENGSTATTATPFVFTSSGSVRFYWANTGLAPGSYAITVTNPASAGELSGTLNSAFVVSASQPTVSGSAPPLVIYGITPSSSITVSGNGFVLGARITVGTPVDGTCAVPSCLSGVTVSGPTATASTPFVFTSSGSVRFYWASTSLAPNSYAITVTNPASAGSGTHTLTNAFTVSAPDPVIGATAPNPVTYDVLLSRAIAITGSSFIVGATVTIGSPAGGPCPLPPRSTCVTGTTVSGTSATAATPFVQVTSNLLSFYWGNTSLAPERSYDVTVTNPTAAGGQSTTLPNGFRVAGPVPVITGVTPSSVEYNDTPDTSVRITGALFYEPQAGDPLTVTVGPLTYSCVAGTAPANAATPCVHISRSAIEFYWVKTADPANRFHLAPGTYSVTVTNPGYVGAASSAPLAHGFTVTAPQPQIVANGVRPRAVTAGITSSRSVDIVGVNNAANHFGFVPDAQIDVVGVGLPSTENLSCTAVSDPEIGVVPSASNRCVYVSPGLLRFYWDTDEAADTANPILGPGTYNVTVTNPASRGGLGHTLDGGFRVTVLPELIEVAPTTGVGSGARSAVLTLTTAGFASGAVVRIGTPQPDPANSNNPQYVQTQDHQVTMRSAFRALTSGDGGTVVIDVAEDPAQTTNRELAVTITSADGIYRFTCPDSSSADTCQSGLIITPSPVVTSITSALVGTSERNLTITGSRFVAPVAVTLPTGVSGACTTTNATAITCRDVTNVSPGSWPVIVTNPDGGRTTGTWTVGALPVISSITPGSGAAGATVPVRIAGSGFQTGIGLTFGGLISGINVTNVTVVNAGTVDANFVIAAGAADGYRTLTAANPDGGAAIAPQAFYVGTLPADAAAVLATYGEQDQSLVQYQRSFGAGWSARSSGPALASPPVWQVMKASPVRDERLLAVVDDQRRLTLHVWTGQMWTGAINAAAGGGVARPTQTVDVAFEQQSGRGMAVYATADTTLKYRIWDGAGWTAEARVEDFLNGQPTNGRPVWVRLEARPGTNDLVLAYEDSNNDVAAMRWSGTTQSWSDAVLLTTRAPGHDVPLVDVAFENLTGRALVAWATTESPAGRPRYRLWSGAWDPEAMAQLGGAGNSTLFSGVSSTATNLELAGAIDFPESGVVSVDSEVIRYSTKTISGGAIPITTLTGLTRGEFGTTPAAHLSEAIVHVAPSSLRLVGGHPSNRQALVTSQGSRLMVQLWDGQQWGAGTTLTTETINEGHGRAFDAAWEGSTGNLVAAYATRTATGGASQSWSPSGGWSAPTSLEAASPETVLATSLSTAVTSADATFVLVGATNFPGAGVVLIDTELVRYTSKSTVTSGGTTRTSLVGLTRGVFGTTAAAHASGATVRFSPYPAWIELSGAGGINDLAMGLFDTQGRVTLRRWTGASWSAATEAQPLGSGLVSVFDETLGRATVMSGKAVAVTLAQHMRRTSTGDTIPPGTPTLSLGTVTMNSAGLSWTAVASDGLLTGGTVARYELRQILGTTVITQIVLASQAPGGVETYAVTGLSGAKTYQFDVCAVDASGNRSLASNRVTVTTSAATPPGVTDLAIAADSIRRTSLSLVWTRPLMGSDHAPLSHYIVKYKTGAAFVSEQEFDAAQPELRATATSLAIDGLQLGETYAFALKVVDALGASSAMSNVVQATTADHSPDPISDLRIVGGPTTTSVTLRWTMPADDSGAIVSYVTKYTASSAIGAIATEAEFADPAVLTFAGQPTRDTTIEPFVETLVVTGLTPGTQYWFSVKARDFADQLSPLSGSPDATTSSGTADTIAPDPITDLVVVATSTSSTSLTLSWTATGDDGTVGNATEYDVRYAAFPLTDQNFGDGIGVTASEPEPPGTREQLTLVGLSSNTQYFVRIKVLDEARNVALSTLAVGQTGLRSGYTLVSIPKVLEPPNDSVLGVFRDDVGSTLTVYRWNSAGVDDVNGCYDGYPTPFSSDPQYTCSSIQTVGTGLGYYLYNATQSINGVAVLDAVGSSVGPPTYDIQLELGFNMVGNPYERDIHLSAVSVKRGATGTPVPYQHAISNGWVGPSLLLFDGVVSQPFGVSDPGAIFKPWNGGWIQSFVTDAILVFSSP